MKHYGLPNKDTAAGAVILADGDFPSGETAAGILRRALFVVCCDGAADRYTAEGGTPAAIVGDGDSISSQLKDKYSDRTFFSPEQESNDLTKSVRFCTERGINDIIIVGATGKREDHTIANVSLLADYASAADVCIVTDYGVFNAIESDSSFDGFPGQQVSIFTIADTTPIAVEGLKYIPPANGLCSWWRGSLNESSGDSFIIKTTGRTLIFRTFER